MCPKAGPRVNKLGDPLVRNLPGGLKKCGSCEAALSNYSTALLLGGATTYWWPVPPKLARLAGTMV